MGVETTVLGNQEHYLEIEKPKERGKHRVLVEKEMIRRREREFSHQQMWSGADKYFRHWEKANTRYDAWTSPRYYEDNNKLLSEIRNKKDKEELLEKRREKLKKQLEEETRSYEIELMIQKTKAMSQKPTNSKLDEIPTEVLKEINDSLKEEEEIRRKREAESKLFDQWRRNNPVIRQFESKYKTKDLKLSWLDQQIEKQMQKEREEEQARRVLKERDEKLKKAQEYEERFKRELREKEMNLKEDLKNQMEQLRKRQDIAEELRRKEDEELRRKIEINDIAEKQKIEEARRANRECALYNIRQHKLKLKRRAANIQEDLAHEKLLLARLKEINLEEIISDELKRDEIRNNLAEFAKLVKENQELEKQRQRHLEFLFDSEAKTIYDKQTNMWKQEEAIRQNLLKEVIGGIKQQIEENVERNKQRQREILLEREEMTKKVEEYDKELRRLGEEEERRKVDRKKMIDDDVKVKNAKTKLQESFKLKEINAELDRIRKEEERLKQEIVKIQQRQGPYKPARSRLFL